jgi:hypothetical protein
MQECTVWKAAELAKLNRTTFQTVQRFVLLHFHFTAHAAH